MQADKPKHGIDAATRLGGLKKRPVSGAVPAKVRCPSGGNKQRSNSSEARAKKSAEKIPTTRDIPCVDKKPSQGRKSPCEPTSEKPNVENGGNDVTHQEEQTISGKFKSILLKN